MDGKITFQELTPYSNADDSVYWEAIAHCFEQDTIRNVAISGAYGAGKSSVLLSYEERNRERRFLHISLAHFEDTKPAQPEKESVLEGKILNQLLHQLSPEDIPQSNFRVKREIKKSTVGLYSAAVVLYGLLVLYLLKFDRWCAYYNSLSPRKLSLLQFSVGDRMPIFAALLLLLMSGFFLYKLICAQKERNLLKKLSVQGNEIEIFSQSEDSCFDKYLNEVLYLFSHAPADVIVFEDLDRFEANRIFERLHEINTLVNRQRKAEGRPPLRFFYLLRDDIFTSKDRTKFFDFIIPVVPVVDGSNSYDKLKEFLELDGCYERFDDHFLKDISLYIDEMRVLKNICNEFFIYIRTLNTTELDYNKMFALIVYKNLFPADFGELQLNRGYVASLFAYKEAFIEEEKGKIEKKIEEKTKHLASIERESAKDIGELQFLRQNYKISPDEYTSRANNIKHRDDAYREEIRQDITALRASSSTMALLPLKELITRENIDGFFSPAVQSDGFQAIRSSSYFPLLKFLIRTGYIDETHSDYMTYFYENSLCAGDKIFLRSVTDRKAKSFDYALRSPALVASRLRETDYDQEETLNFDLLDYILEDETQNNSVEHLFRQLRELREGKKYPFAVEYFERTEKKDAFVQRANQLWPGLFSELYAAGQLVSDAWLKDYSLRTLCTCSDGTILAVNADDALTRYISEAKDYLNIVEPQTEQLIAGFRLLAVSFQKIIPASSNADLLRRVYEEGLYSLNFDNITAFLGYELPNLPPATIREQNYSLVLHTGESPLHKKIRENMEAYLHLILENSGGTIKDKPKAILAILNCEELSREDKTRYIQLLHYSAHIRSLCYVSDRELWCDIVHSRVWIDGRENILAYFEFAGEINEELLILIDRTTNLDFSNMGGNYSEKLLSSFFDAVVSCGDMDNSKYKEIVCSLGKEIPSLTLEGLSAQKLRILIDYHILLMTPDNLRFLRRIYSTETMLFVLNNADSYLELMSDALFSTDELLVFLDSTASDEQKLQLLSFAHDPIPTIGTKYSLPVKLCILQNNPKTEEMPAYYESYDTEEPEIQDTVYAYALTQLPQLAENCETASVQLLNRIFESPLKMSEKLPVLTNCALCRSEEDFRSFLATLGMTDFDKAFWKKTFQVTTTYSDLLEAMKSRGWIVKYTQNSSGKGPYKITARGALPSH